MPFVTHFFVDFYMMFQRLQQKWKVNGKQLRIIFIIFAITGTTTAYLTKAITTLLGFDENTWWFYKLLLRVGMLLIGYWILLLLFSALFGQLKFFRQFVKGILQKTGVIKKDKVNEKTVENKTAIAPVTKITPNK